jgi:hypothetical protein
MQEIWTDLYNGQRFNFVGDHMNYGKPENLPIVQIRPNLLHSAYKKAVQTRVVEHEAVCTALLPGPGHPN